MALTRSKLRVVLLTGLAACSSRPLDGEGSSSSSESTDASEATSTSGSTDTPGPTDTSDSTSTDTGEPTSPCDCDPGQLCAADCIEPGLGFPNFPPYPSDFRCVDDPACPPDDFDTPACRELVCGSPYVFLVDECASAEDEPPGIDLLCSSDTEYTCNTKTQDCPDGEKCIARPVDDEGLFPTQCVASEGTDPSGAPCTANGDPEYTDSCDDDSMCWSGQLTTAPFDGVCLAYCKPLLDPVCPDGSTCELLADGLELCAPAP